MLHSILTAVFFALWLGGGIILLVRFRVGQNTYLRQIHELDDVPLDGAPIGMPPGAWPTVWEAMWDWQENPAREALRHAMWVRFRWMVAWGFGFPLTIAALLVTLILTGHSALLGG